MKLVEPERIEGVVSKDISKKEINKHLKTGLPNKMAKYCGENERALGLSAPQIGLFQRFFVAYIKGVWRVYYNPKITSKSKETANVEEGCLSYPGLTVETERAADIKVQYFNGKKMVIEQFSNLNALVFQHETDHLAGITIQTLVDEGLARVKQ